MTAANELTASQARAAMDAGEISAGDLLAACRARIAERDGDVKAWCHLGEGNAPTGAGPLAGIPVGIKDIIDTVDMPTTYGSKVYPNHQPAMDAACVALVRAAGGMVLGKTVSTEFAY
ncbi:MAG: amidase, partial [Rhodospirillaceae bacterium]|nr:amidase [Rhodospirillaceae bacterium]